MAPGRPPSFPHEWPGGPRAPARRVCLTWPAMSTDRSTRDRGSLFENAQKRKPSQPDLQGDCSIAGAPYEVRAWRREEQLTITVAPPRGDQNTYPPDAFRGALDATPKPTSSKRGAAKEAAAIAAWSGDIVGDEASYKVSAFEKQGKSGTYFTLSFDRIERAAVVAAPEPETELSSED
jgi:hypothetical protein